MIFDIPFSSHLVAPEITVDNPIVHTAPGMEVKLDCFVNSYPDAKIHWFFNGMPVRKNNLITMTEFDLVSVERNIQSNFMVLILLILNLSLHKIQIFIIQKSVTRLKFVMFVSLILENMNVKQQILWGLCLVRWS